MDSKIIQQIENLFSSVDKRDWRGVESTMSSTVLLDYTSMTGKPAVSLRPVEITKAWAAFLPGFDSTQHHLSNFLIKANGENAEAHFDGKADHFLNGEVWIVQGSYDAKLKLQNNEWRITDFKFNFREQSGNTNLPAHVTEKLQNRS